MDSSREADPRSLVDRLCPLRVITSNWLALWLEELAVALALPVATWLASPR